MVSDAVRYTGWALAVVLFAGIIVGQALGQPVFLIVVETDSMEPTIEPGDAVVVVPDFATDRSYESGDVVLFDDVTLDERRPTTHRIVEETDDGFITQGDGNSVTDQASQEPPVTRNRILGYVPSVGGEPVVLPVVGTVVSTVQGALGGDSTLIIALGVGIAALGVLSSSFESQRYVRDTTRRRRLRPLVLILVFAVLLVTLATAAMVLPSGPQGIGIEATDRGAESEGVYATGDSTTITYGFDNSGYVPLVVVVEPESDVVTDQPVGLVVGPRGTAEQNLSVAVPEEPGVYQVALTEHRYLALLPPGLIVTLHEAHPAAALVAVNTVVVLGVAVSVLLFVGIEPIPSRSQSHNAPVRVRVRRRLRALLGRE